MEPLSDRLRTRGYAPARILLILFSCSLLGAPFLVMLARLLIHLRSEELSFVFFRILSTSLLYTIAQSTLSALLSVGFGLTLGLAVGLQRGHRIHWLTWALDVFGTFSFVLPGIVVSLLVLQLNHYCQWLPSEGIFAVAVAHLFLNGFFVASSVERRTRGWIQAGGHELLESAALLGAKGRHLLAPLWRPVLWEEARLWFPLIFLWSFGAFATPLILGGATNAISPEVLLFYSLANDPSSSRILILVLVQLVVGSFWAHRASRLSQKRPHEAATSTQTEPHPQTESSSWMTDQLHLRWVMAGAFLLLGIPLLSIVVAPLLATIQTHRTGFTELVPSLLNTITLAMMVLVISAFFTLLLTLAGTRVRQNTALMAGLSSTLIASAWMGSGFDTIFHDSVAGQFVAASLGISLAWLPLCALWIDNRLRAIPQELFDSAATLGASPIHLFRFLIAPTLRDVFSKIFLIVFVGALGELSATGLFIVDAEVAAFHARIAAQRYDFSASSVLLACILILTACGVLVDRRLRRKASL